MPWTMHEYADADALAESCALRIDDAIDSALLERGRAVLALAGGRTSPPIFRRLTPGTRDWSRVHIVPSDERWVNADHPDGNLRQMRDAFAGADGIHWLPLVPAQPCGDADASFAIKVLAPYPQAFDVCVLGMGTDGHFASLFPGAANLAQALDLANADAAVAIVPDPMPAAGAHARVSLTLARILNSRRLLLAITGNDKRRVLERARDGGTRLPVAALLAAAHPAASIHWSP
ncbi:MAG TPA: 6-phosphogluconolactonase [Patescibacteria group bacterium]|nr:6-phosphogluconolactonase [Patescibacteria group bacterium]